MKELLKTIFWICITVLMFFCFYLFNRHKTNQCQELNPNSEYSEILKICTLKK